MPRTGQSRWREKFTPPPPPPQSSSRPSSGSKREAPAPLTCSSSSDDEPSSPLLSAQNPSQPLWPDSRVRLNCSQPSSREPTTASSGESCASSGESCASPGESRASSGESRASSGESREPVKSYELDLTAHEELDLECSEHDLEFKSPVDDRSDDRSSGILSPGSSTTEHQILSPGSPCSTVSSASSCGPHYQDRMPGFNHHAHAFTLNHAHAGKKGAGKKMRKPSNILEESGNTEKIGPEMKRSTHGNQSERFVIKNPLTYFTCPSIKSRLVGGPPMRTRRLPASYWEEPPLKPPVHSHANFSSYTVLPPLFSRETCEDLTCVRPVTPPPEERSRHKQQHLVTHTDTDLLHSLFDSVRDHASVKTTATAAATARTAKKAFQRKRPESLPASEPKPPPPPAMQHGRDPLLPEAAALPPLSGTLDPAAGPTSPAAAAPTEGTGHLPLLGSTATHQYSLLLQEVVATF